MLPLLLALRMTLGATQTCGGFKATIAGRATQNLADCPTVLWLREVSWIGVMESQGSPPRHLRINSSPADNQAGAI